MGCRSRLMPAPQAGSKSDRKSARRAARSSLLAMSQAEESVSEAPKPSLAWKREVSSMVMVESGGAPEGRANARSTDRRSSSFD